MSMEAVQNLNFKSYKAKIWILYGLFVLFAIAQLMLSFYQIAYMGIIAPILLLIFTLALNLKWVHLIKAYLGILFLVPIAPYELFGDLPVDIEPNRVFFFMLLFIWLLMLLIDPALKPRKSGLELPMFVFTVAILSSFVLNISDFSDNDKIGAIKSLLLFLSYILSFYLILTVIRSFNEIESIAKWLVFISIIVSFFAIIERYSGYNLFKHLHEFLPFLRVDLYQATDTLTRGGALRVSGSADHPIALATILSMFLPLIFFFLFKSLNALEKLWYGMGLVVILIAALFTISATALVGILIALLSQVIINPRRGLVIFILVFIFVLYSSVVFSADYERLLERASYGYITKNEIGNENGRLADYPKVWQLFKEKPFFGRGFGTFNPLKYFYLDNQYLGFIVETGIIGTLCFISFLYFLIRKLLNSIKISCNGLGQMNSKKIKEFEGAILSSIIIFAITCFTFDTFGFAQVIYAFFILSGLGIGFGLIASEQVNPH